VRVPVACTLTSEAATARVRDWTDLLRGAGAQIRGVDGGVELRMPATASTSTAVAGLVEAERACCAWADWARADEHGAITVRVTATDVAGIETLRGMFGARA
jgi:hypothetical protein